MADSTTEKGLSRATGNTKLNLGQKLNLPVEPRSFDGMNWTNFKSPFPNGIAFSQPPKAHELDQDKELERALSHGKSYDEIYSAGSHGKEQGFGVKVGGADIPLKTGLTIWDLRDSVLSRPDQRDDLRHGPEQNLAPDYSDRFNTKGAKFGLSWTARF